MRSPRVEPSRQPLLDSNCPGWIPEPPLWTRSGTLSRPSSAPPILWDPGEVGLLKMKFLSRRATRRLGARSVETGTLPTPLLLEPRLFRMAGVAERDQELVRVGIEAAGEQQLEGRVMVNLGGELAVAVLADRVLELIFGGRRSASACVRRSDCAPSRPCAAPCCDHVPSPCGAHRNVLGPWRTGGTRVRDRAGAASARHRHCHHVLVAFRAAQFELALAVGRPDRRIVAAAEQDQRVVALAARLVAAQPIEFGAKVSASAIENNFLVGVASQPGTSACRPWPTAPSP